MNIHDKAYELARAIKESSEYKEMIQAKAAIDADNVSKAMLDDLRRLQAELQQRAMSGAMPEQEEMANAQKLYEAAARNPAIGRLFEAERRFSMALEDVQRIIAEPLQAMMQQ